MGEGVLLNGEEILLDGRGGTTGWERGTTEWGGGREYIPLEGEGVLLEKGWWAQKQLGKQEPPPSPKKPCKNTVSEYYNYSYLHGVY